MTAPPPRTHFLRTLGLAGWDALDPVFLAAVAAEPPLLLVGPHGSAKTMVLNRLAAALGLEHRHYNASLLSFDDLVGFPVPEDGRVVYLQTPATVWEAESVLVDEVSRCRPVVQNKLFPLVHERVIQGLPLPRLKHRWAAMNPPASLDGDDAGGPAYSGAEPLDVALADRFAFVVTVPSLAQLSPDDQRRVLRPSTWSAEEARPAVARLVEAAREALAPAARSEAAAAASPRPPPSPASPSPSTATSRRTRRPRSSPTPTSPCRSPSTSSPPRSSCRASRSGATSPPSPSRPSRTTGRASEKPATAA